MTSLQVGHDITAKVRTADVSLEKNVSFKELFLSENVLSGLNKAGFHRPSPIQLNAIPFGRCGLDLIVQAKSGTGKTCVFSVIALEAVVTGTSALQAIVLAPTREIAVQINSVLEAIGQCMKDLVVRCFIGGRPVSEDKANSRGCHIAVGTPGRMFQLLQLGILSCENVRLFVLDEADKLLEHNFQSQINSIYSILPVNKQMIAASATYPEELAQFVTKYMQDPTFVRLNPKDLALLGIKQYIHEIPRPVDKYLSDFEYKIKAIVNLLEAYTFTQALVFSNYHSHAKDLSDACNSVGLSATFISGNLTQTKRLEAIQLLKEYKCKVLISTDLTSRGIDASNVDLVINLDVPHDWETYMHRTGRAGRFGSLGAVISVVLAGSETANLLEITESCNIPVYPIACVNGTISLAMQPLSNQLLNKEETTVQDAVSKRGSHGSNACGKEIENCHVTQKQLMSSQNYIADTSSGSLSTTEVSSGDCQKLKLPKILSMPELMQKNKSKMPCFSYDVLLGSFTAFKNHGKLKELDQIMISDAKRTECGVHSCGLVESLTQNRMPSNYLDGPIGLLKETREVMTSPRKNIQESRSHHVEDTPYFNGAYIALETVPAKNLLDTKSMVHEEITRKVSRDGEYVRHEGPNTSGKKTSDTKRHRIVKSVPKDRQFQYSSYRSSRHTIPMLLPRWSNSQNIVRPNVSGSFHRAHGRELAWKCHSYILMYWMWLNQYLYVQSWFSNA